MRTRAFLIAIVCGCLAVRSVPKAQVLSPTPPHAAAPVNQWGFLAYTGYFDPSAAVGPSNIAVAGANLVRVFSRANVNTYFNLDLLALAGGNGVNYPQVYYDPSSSRWFVVAVSLPTSQTTPNKLFLMVSSGPSPVGASSFQTYQVQQDQVGTTPNADTGYFVNWARIAVDANAVYVGANVYNDAGLSTFRSSTVFVFNKASLIAGTINATAFRSIGSPSGGLTSPVPVTPDDPQQSTAYIAGVDGASMGRLVLRAITNAGTTPSISSDIIIPVDPTARPVTMVTCDSALVAADDRITSAMMKRNRDTGALSLWLAQDVSVDQYGISRVTTLARSNPTLSSNDRDAIRWYEIRSLSTTPSVVQTNTYADTTTPTGQGYYPWFYYAPSMAVTGEGRAVLGFTYSRLGQCPSAGVVTSAASTPQTNSFARLALGYNPFRSNWSSESATVVDPLDGQSVFTVQTYLADPGGYGPGFYVANIYAPPPVTPNPADTAVAPGVTSANITITGPSVNESAFFDAGPSYSNHISASVSGGVVVNSTTYVNPTTITLNVSTVGVTPGFKTLTVTNPDGQFISVPGALPVGAMMTLDKGSVQFGAVSNGAGFTSVTAPQAVRLIESGGGTVTWSASSTVPWLTVSPTSGTGSATLTLSSRFVAGLGATQSGTVSISFSGALNTSAQVSTTLNVTNASATAGPFGSFDTPADGATGLTGSIPVTGWALDDVGVTGVRIVRAPVAGESAGLVFIGNAIRVDGARSDVAAAYPSLPQNTRAGWGYLLLTNFLPNQGNGTFTLYAYADDADGHSTLLGTKTIACTNSTATAPFGAIDTPAQGDTVSGVVNNFGWALVKGSARADVPGGGTVTVLVDGIPVGTPSGWTNRSDISLLFPSGYSSTSSAVAVFPLDTTTLSNGVHTIAWGVTATNGQSAGIGSRYFTVANGAAFRLPPSREALRRTAVALAEAGQAEEPSTAGRAIWGRTGFDLDAPLRQYLPGPDGVVVVDAHEMDRVELHVDATIGSLETATGLQHLPIGSQLRDGVFTWTPGVGFVGAYDLVFDDLHVRIVLHSKGS